MYMWKITKYNPIFRNTRGVFTKNDWSSFSDIGKTFNDKMFTADKYLHVEDAYIAAINAFLACNNLKELIVTNLEKNEPPEINVFYTEGMISIFHSVKEGDIVNERTIQILSRFILRETLWCKLESEKMYVHFGWDYYMYIGSNNFCKKQITDIEQSGLFVEKCPSPYH